ncbi:MAG: hypothetical protein ACHWZW_02850 [Spirulina sp.]
MSIQALAQQAQQRIEQAERAQQEALKAKVSAAISRAEADARLVLERVGIIGGNPIDLYTALGMGLKVECHRANVEIGKVAAVFFVEDDRGRKVECHLEISLPGAKSAYGSSKGDVVALCFPMAVKDENGYMRWAVTPPHATTARMDDYHLPDMLSWPEMIALMVHQYGESMARNRAAIAAEEDRYSRVRAMEQQRKLEIAQQEALEKELEAQETAILAVVDAAASAYTPWPCGHDEPLTVYRWSWCCGAYEDGDGDAQFDYDEAWSLTDQPDDDGYIELFRNRCHAQGAPTRLIDHIHRPVVTRHQITSDPATWPPALTVYRDGQIVGVNALDDGSYYTWDGGGEPTTMIRSVRSLADWVLNAIHVPTDQPVIRVLPPVQAQVVAADL